MVSSFVLGISDEKQTINPLTSLHCAFKDSMSKISLYGYEFII